jgi:hypothetical protein
MIKIIYYTIIFVFILNCASCINKGSGLDTRLHIVNNSTNTIVTQLSCLFPDSSLDVNFYTKQNNICVDTSSNNQIYPGSSLAFKVAGSWGYIFSHYIPSDTLQIFIYDYATFKNNSWDTIVSKYLILKKYDLTLDSLEKLNWIIKYP